MQIENIKEQLKNNDRYLHHYYCNHLNVELNRTLTIKCDRETTKQKEKRLNDLFNHYQKETEIDIINIEKLESLYKHEEIEWLKRIVTLAENLPICITVSSAMKRFRGFPLIYINKQFEKMTKYNRIDIIGKNCRFLQPDTIPEDENIQHILMKHSLEQKLPISVIITNVKADGTLFQNLLSLAPIIDKHDNYLYVIGVQTELQPDNINFEDIQNVIDLISILSNKI